MSSEAQQAVDLTPLGTEEEFAAMIDEMVAEDLPRVFALVEECGERADGRIFGWGMAFEDHAELVSVGGGVRGSFRSAESARRTFARRRKVRLVWAMPERSPAQSDAWHHPR
jgi:hypothetical protein